tara:strand:+ start:2396 stop:3214 length:819 start_codon:yes stop_codon:yes gene_type:complete
MNMAYAIKCEDCGNNFTKFSNRDANRKCEECKPRKGNRYRERRNVVDEFTTRLTNLEGWQERMQIEMELWQDAVQAEMLGKVEEVFAENMESMRPDFGPELTKIEENLANKLATINTRVMALSPNSIAMDKLNDLDVRTDAKLSQMETLFTRMNSLLGDGKWTEPTKKFKPIRRSAVKLTLQTRMTLVDAALQFMFDEGDATRLFKRGDLTDGPWRGITLNSASRLMQDMLRAKQIIRASPKSHHYGLHPDEYERRCLTIPIEEDDSDIKKR